MSIEPRFRAHAVSPRAVAEKLSEEVGQRLTAISLAVLVLAREGANPQALETIRLALEEARHELKTASANRSPEGG
jgi:hypothetical protein